MTWKEKKDLENRKVVALGGKVKPFFPESVSLISLDIGFCFKSFYFSVDTASKEPEITPKRSTSNNEEAKRKRPEITRRGG